ncbi:MAG: DUF5343 domain-containing protein [candidate division Zixibacteria bacterium]|nr:DUF5343 domain-containing protein [candidate division Zixibacteria bacterium]
MALTNAYVQIYGQLLDFFKKIAEGQAPERFTRQHLKDLGFRSSNHHALIPLLKALGFLSSEGIPTSRYHEYRSTAQSRNVMAEALREAYGDLFVIKERPTDTDNAIIQGKFKSTHNVSDHVAQLMAKTFFSLLSLADLNEVTPPKPKPKKPSKEKAEEEKPKAEISEVQLPVPPGLHYNIQIHLPATKDIEVFNAIFKSLKEHLIG